jgi:adenylate kinase family enzyme
MCELLAKDHDFIHLSAGELLRKEMEKDSPLQKVISETISKGKIIDGTITTKLLKEEMER